MTTRISIILNLILIGAVIHLYSLQYGGKAKETASDNEIEEDSTSAKKPGPSLSADNNLKIAFVNGDTIHNNYQFIEDMYEEMGSERLKAERQLQKKIQEFEQEYKQLQEEAAYMTQDELEKAQRNIKAKQQKLQKQREDLSGNLMKKEERLQEKFFKNVNGFLESFNDSQGYDLILNYRKGGQILIADDSLEITQEVLNGLNESYRSESK